jgi:hypothetical protein
MSPPANTPGSEVSPFSSVTSNPSASASRPSASNAAGFGRLPMATMTWSTSSVNSSPVGSGRRRPESSG